MAEMYNAHIKVGEQNIDKTEYDEMILKGELKYPVIRVTTELQISKHSFNAIKNSFDLKNGTHYLYVYIGDKLICIGKVNLDISSIHRLKNLLRRLKPVIDISESVEDEFKEINVKDLVNTIELEI